LRKNRSYFINHLPPLFMPCKELTGKKASNVALRRQQNSSTGSLSNIMARKTMYISTVGGGAMALVFRDIPDPVGGLSRRGGKSGSKAARHAEEAPAKAYASAALRRDFTALAAMLPDKAPAYNSADRSRAGY